LTQIISITTEPGRHRYNEDDLMHYLDRLVMDPIALRKLKFVTRESGVKTKYSVLPDFRGEHSDPILFKNPEKLPSIAERMNVFTKEAPDLAEKTARKALAHQNMNGSDLDAIVTVSCTGMYAPGLEVDLATRLNMSPSAKRHAVNYMGCYAAFHGLRLADLICQSNRKAKVLVVCVELCSLHFRNDTSDDNLLSTALFSDGAAAVILSGDEAGLPAMAEISRFDSFLIPDAKEAMGWYIENDGFRMVLKRSVPAFVEQQMALAFSEATKGLGVSITDLDEFAIHPGGKSVLHAFAKALDVDSSALATSFDVLEQFGNMSSPTVLFVLERILKKEKNSPYIYSAAFGPGLTIESAVFKRIPS